MIRSPLRARLARPAFAAALLATAAAPGGAVAAPAPALRPSVDAVTCRSACQAIDRAAPGSVVQISGPNMGAATQVVLLGRRGRRDDKVVSAVPVTPTATLVTVPRGARTGPVRAVTSAGVRSAASTRRLLVGRAGAEPAKGAVLQARADVRRVVAGVTPSVSFFVRTAEAQDVSVDVLRGSTVVAHWDLAQVPGRSVRSVAWDAGASAEGRYTWRVLLRSQAEAVAASSPARTGGGAAAPGTAVRASSVSRGPAFYVVRHVFPIAGPHTYNLDAGRFGTGRAGHTHQGQDVFADCGTPLVAVTGATVKYAGRQSAAGNYIVLTGDDGNDYAYMHLRAPSPLKKGQTVAAGALVGAVGDTGDAVGCHLHFEIWPAPGWYSGGSPIDPLPSLRAWDA